MKMKKFAVYLRVSTAKQGQSGLGLDAQKSAVEYFAKVNGGEIVATFVEVESGKNDKREQLSKALEFAEVTNSVLLISTLDRLSRDTAFLMNIRKANVRIMTCDGAAQDGDVLAWGVKSLMAQAEREKISERTRNALQAAKARGVKLGNPNGAEPFRRAGKGNTDSRAAMKANADTFARKLRNIIADYRSKADVPPSLRQIAAYLNSLGVETAQKKAWHASNVANLLRRLETATT